MVGDLLDIAVEDADLDTFDDLDTKDSFGKEVHYHCTKLYCTKVPKFSTFQFYFFMFAGLIY